MKDGEIIAIRQYCLDRAMTILAVAKETVTLDRHLEVATEIEDFLMQEVDKQKAQLGRD